MADRLERSWSAWFDGMEITTEPCGITVITRDVADQAALHGLPARLRDLALPLLSVQRLGPWHGDRGL